MSGSLFLEPTGLTSQVFAQLEQYYKALTPDSYDECIEKVRLHVEEARKKVSITATVNLPLAEAILNSFELLKEEWEELPPAGRTWLCAAMIYFAEADDADQHDFFSFLGFEDDAEVLNACLALVGKKSLSVNPADFD